MPEVFGPLTVQDTEQVVVAAAIDQGLLLAHHRYHLLAAVVLDKMALDLAVTVAHMVLPAVPQARALPTEAVVVVDRVIARPQDQQPQLRAATVAAVDQECVLYNIPVERY
jgi:hypothetical protein